MICKEIGLDVGHSEENFILKGVFNEKLKSWSKNDNHGHDGIHYGKMHLK